MSSRTFSRRRCGQLGIESIVWWALFLLFAYSISSFVLGFLNAVVNPPPTKYFYIFPLAGSGTDLNNGIIGVPQMEKLYNQVRDVSFLLLGTVFMFAALTFVLENFNIMNPGTAWNIIAKSIFYVVTIWLLLWLYNGVAAGVSQLTLYFDKLPDGSSAAETVWKKFSSIVFAPQGENWWSNIGNIGNALAGSVTVPVIAILAFTTAVIVWVTSVGRIVILAATVCSLPLALIFDLIPPLKRFADTLFGIVIGLTFSPIIVAIMFNISVPIADAIVCTSNIPLFHILVYGAIVSMGGVVIVAFAPMVGSAVSAASTTALSGAGAVIASGMMIGQTATMGGASFGTGAITAARAGLPKREALKVGGMTGLKATGTTLAATSVQTAMGAKMPSAIGVTGPEYTKNVARQHIQPHYNKGVVALAGTLPKDLEEMNLAKHQEYQNYAKSFLSMNPSERREILASSGLKRDQAEMFAEAVESNRGYFMDSEHATALGYYLKEGAVAGLLQKNTPATIVHIAHAGGWRGTAEGLKRSPEERIDDIDKTFSSVDHLDEEHRWDFESKRARIEHDIEEYHRIGAISEKKKQKHKDNLNFLRSLILLKPREKFSYEFKPTTVKDFPPQSSKPATGEKTPEAKQPEKLGKPETGQEKTEENEHGPFSEYVERTLGNKGGKKGA
jgi:hypothetical protein